MQCFTKKLLEEAMRLDPTVNALMAREGGSAVGKVRLPISGNSMSDKSVRVGVWRGLVCRCPNCGKGRLYNGFLTPVTQCEVCGNDNMIYPSDDLPPYLTVLLVGHIIVGLLLWVNLNFTLSIALQMFIWLPATALLSLALMQPIKGAAIGICWATNIVRS
jgi:uncharacterized protein (DUF983 family)